MVRFSLTPELISSGNEKRPYQTAAAKSPAKKTKTKQTRSSPKPALKNSLQKLRVLGPQTESEVSHGKFQQRNMLLDFE